MIVTRKLLTFLAARMAMMEPRKTKSAKFVSSASLLILSSSWK